MNKRIIEVTEQNLSLLEEFIANMGNSSLTFRYFANRNPSCIKNHLVCYLILDKNEPIAYGHLDKEGIDVWLGVCVKESKKGLGLGKEMMNHLLNFAKLKKIPKIRLSVDKKNVNAIKMYNKFGFIEQKSSGTILFMDLDIV